MNGNIKQLESQYFQHRETKRLYLARHLECQIGDPTLENTFSVRYFRITYMYNSYLDQWMELHFDHMGAYSFHNSNKLPREIPKTYLDECTLLSEEEAIMEKNKIRMLEELSK